MLATYRLAFAPFIRGAAGGISRQAGFVMVSLLTIRLNFPGFVRVAAPAIPLHIQLIPWGECSVSSALLKHLVKIAQADLRYRPEFWIWCYLMAAMAIIEPARKDHTTVV